MRFAHCVFARMLRTCDSTVRSDNTSRAAICRLPERFGPIGHQVTEPHPFRRVTGVHERHLARVRGTARLDLRDAGIRLPGFLVRRFVDLTVSTQLTQQA